MIGFEELCSAVQREFVAGRIARAAGNEGRVRVCARRAAGVAIRYWLQRHRDRQWGTDVMQGLRGLQRDPEVPAEVRLAAGRLVERITAQFVPVHGNDPLADAEMIVRSLAGVAFPRGFFGG